MNGMTSLLLASARAAGIRRGSSEWKPCPRAASSLRWDAGLFISQRTQLWDPRLSVHRSSPRETFPQPLGKSLVRLLMELVGTCS